MSEPHAEETPHGDGGQAPAEHEQTERTRKPGARVRIGVGLALVHAVVTRVGGGIKAEPAPEGGACFTVRLPTEPVTPS